MMRPTPPVVVLPIGARSASKGFLRSALACAAGFMLVIQVVDVASAADEKITYDDHLAPILRAALQLLSQSEHEES